MSRIRLISLSFSAFCIILASLAGAFAQEGAHGGYDLDDWYSLVSRAEATVEASAASEAALIVLQSQLLEYRQGAAEAQKPLGEEIDRLNSSIAALGAPDSGQVETEAHLQRRAQLVAELELASGPYYAAAEIVDRSDELISAIDAIIQERRRASLLRLEPSPLSPASWSAAGSELSGFVDGLAARTSGQAKSNARFCGRTFRRFYFTSP